MDLKEVFKRGMEQMGLHNARAMMDYYPRPSEPDAQHLRALYAHGVAFCQAKGVPLSWLRVWGAHSRVYRGLATVYVFLGEQWFCYVPNEATLLHPVSPRHMRQKETYLSRVWIKAPDEDSFKELLASYVVDADPEMEDGLVLGVIRELDHQWDRGRTCERCKTLITPQTTEPCAWLLEPMVDRENPLILPWNIYPARG